MCHCYAYCLAALARYSHILGMNGYTSALNMMLLLLLLLSHFSRVQLCATPQTAAHQAPLFLGFSKQEQWSGLPFPSPMHACMLSHFSRVQLCATPWTAAHQDPVSKGFSRQEQWSGMPFPSPNMMLPIYYLQIAFIRFKKFHLFYILQRLVSMWALFAFIDMIVHIFLTQQIYFVMLN